MLAKDEATQKTITRMSSERIVIVSMRVHFRCKSYRYSHRHWFSKVPYVYYQHFLSVLHDIYSILLMNTTGDSVIPAEIETVTSAMRASLDYTRSYIHESSLSRNTKASIILVPEKWSSAISVTY
jgi:hypothetical protein